MISKEEFVHEVEKEISLLNANGLLQKVTEKKYNHISLYLMYIFFGSAFFFTLLVAWMERFIENNPMIEPMKNLTMLLVFVGMIGLVMYKDKNTFKHEQGKTLQKNYEKILSLIDIKKITDKRFHKFDGIIGLRKPHVCPAYQIDNFTLQNFINRGSGQCNYFEAEILLFFQKESVQKSFTFRDLSYFKDDSAIYQIGKELLPICLFLRGFQNKDEHQIQVNYLYHPSEQTCPFFFLDKTAAYNLFASPDYKHYAERLYDEAIFLKKLSNKLD